MKIHCFDDSVFFLNMKDKSYGLIVKPQINKINLSKKLLTIKYYKCNITDVIFNQRRDYMKKIVVLLLMVNLLLLSGCKNSSVETVQKDYSSCFNGINGCAVFYDYDKEKYDVYNEEQCNTRYSPYSTFKIVAVLEGLNDGVLISKNTKMKYNGEKYPFDMWNKDMNLNEAFQTSCVWYFRQVIDNIGQEKLKEAVDELDYGNCDVSKWEGEPINVQQELNGFWLGSSLEITPMEMVNIVANIFQGKTKYKNNEINILKDIMKSDKEGVYGKTGTGKDNTAWYTGFYEIKNKKIYFAIHLDDNTKNGIVGAEAKELANNIIDRYYRSDM